MNKLASAIAALTLSTQVQALGGQFDGGMIVNGNFGSNPAERCVPGMTGVIPQEYTDSSIGQQWLVTQGNIDLLTSWCSGYGHVTAPNLTDTYVDLNGSFAETGVNASGAITQTVPTLNGQLYKLTFEFGGNPQWLNSIYPNDTKIKGMVVWIDGLLAGTYFVDTGTAAVAVPAVNAQWKKETIIFEANSASTTITFQSLNSSTSDFGPLLTNVAMTVY